MTVRTFGVEEELLLVHAVHGRPTPAGDDVVQAAAELPAAQDQAPLEHEFKKEQTEIGSTPSTEAAALRADLRRLRRQAAAAAAGSGAQIAAIATSPFRVRPTATENDRYLRMGEEFGLLARQQLTCGQHVHVGVDSRAEGVAALDRIAPWLSVVLAMSVNSPFWQGEDSGYLSYRTLSWGLWPTAGPVAQFGDEAGYDRSSADLLAAGSAIDDGMIYFDARLSAHYPTLEIRVADVCTDVDDAVLVGVLCRALVETGVRQSRAGVAAPDLRTELLRAAGWRAARSGLERGLVDLRGPRTVPAWQLVDELVELLRPALAEAGDLELVRAGLDRLRRAGTGARQQLSAFAERGELRDVVQDAVRRTLL